MSSDVAAHRFVLGSHRYVWCRRSPGSAWAFQLVLEESDGADWVYRRDPRIRRPLAGLGDRVLAPEVQLLYKHHAATPKDLADLRNVLPTLTPSARAWYDAAVSTPTFAPSSRPQR